MAGWVVVEGREFVEDRMVVGGTVVIEDMVVIRDSVVIEGSVIFVFDGSVIVVGKEPDEELDDVGKVEFALQQTHPKKRAEEFFPP